jgi:hypothetical protein
MNIYTLQPAPWALARFSKGATTMHTIKLFVASSNELENTRKDLVIRIVGKNKRISQRNAQVDIDEWEFESSGIASSGRIQDEYNKLVAKADIVVVLLRNKIGKYTTEEFETALTLFRTVGKPKVIVYTFSPDKNTGLLDEFLSELRNPSGEYRLEHFPKHVNDNNELWIDINQEIDSILDSYELNHPQNKLLRFFETLNFKKLIIKYAVGFLIFCLLISFSSTMGSDLAHAANRIYIPEGETVNTQIFLATLAFGFIFMLFFIASKIVTVTSSKIRDEPPVDSSSRLFYLDLQQAILVIILLILALLTLMGLFIRNIAYIRFF